MTRNNLPDHLDIHVRQQPKLVGGALLLADDGTFVNTLVHQGEKASHAIAQYKLLQQMSELREPSHRRNFLNKSLLKESEVLPDGVDIDDFPEDIDFDILPPELKDFLEQMFGDRFGTRGHHVATSLDGKTGWREGALVQKGDDPLRDRDYKGHEFQRLLGFGPAQGGKPANPAFWSHFTKIDKETGKPLLDRNGREIPVDCLEDLEGQKLKICLAAELPPHLEHHPVLEEVETLHETGDGHDHGQAEQDVEGEETGFRAPTRFTHVHPRMEKVIRDFVTHSANSGIEVEIVDKPEDAHITVMGFERGDKYPRLLGIASFPDDMNNWPRLDGLGQPRGQGFAFLNNDYSDLDHVSDAELERLFLHECARGHNMGMCHPHDLGNPEMSQAATHAYTLMAYADMHSEDIAGSDPLRVGAVDVGARSWQPDPRPVNEGEGRVYDMQAHTDASFAANKDTRSARASRLLPATAIVDHGTGTELHGTAGNDYIDTNPGYTSTSTKETPGLNGKPIVFRQKFLLAEGHIAKVRGIAGDNIIVASDRGEQVIEPGTGRNEIRFIHEGINSDKTIVSEGTDTLVLRMDRGRKLNAKEVDGKLAIEGENGTITLEGNGLAAIRVIDRRGKELAHVEVGGFSAQQINDDVLAPARQSLAVAERVAQGRSSHADFAEKRAAGMGGRY